MKIYLDIAYLRAKMMSLSNNIEFLEKLARHYSIGSDKFNPQGVNVSDIRMYISDVRRGNDFFYPESLDFAINDMWEKAVFKPVVRTTGEIKQNYRGSRDLGMFLYKYEKSLEKKEQIQETKVEAKEDHPLEPEWEQITLFDLLNKQGNKVVEEPQKFVLSSEGEPLFPPNSEEERDYLRYLEELERIADNEPIESHPHYRR